MKPITEEMQQNLLDWIPEHIEHLKSEGGLSTYAKNCIASLEIALASLTTGLIGVVNRGSTSDNNEFLDAKVECVHPQAGWENFQDGFTLYTAPPVPVVKLPEKYSDHEGFLTDTEQGYNDAIDEVASIINGLS